MIHRLELDDYFSPLTEPELEALKAKVLSDYPYPLSVSFSNVLSAPPEPLARVSVLMKDMLSTLLQYLALLMLHDYANAPVERSFHLFTMIESMVYMAGPGKWLGFLRESKRYYEQTGNLAHAPFLFEFLDKHHGRRGTKLKLIANEDETPQGLPTLEALVAIRNRWAHSRHMTDRNARSLDAALTLVMYHLYRDLAPLAGYPLIARTEDGVPVQLRGSRLPDEMGDREGPFQIFLGSPSDDRPLLRLFLHHNVERSRPEILLFEELIKERRAVFSSSFHDHRFSRDKPEESSVVEGIIQILDRVRPANEILTVGRTTFRALRGRMNEATAQTYSDFLAAGKYDPHLYIPPGDLADQSNQFLASDAPLYLLTGEQGSGKSAAVCHWAADALGLSAPDESGPLVGDDGSPGVLLLEASRANAFRNVPNLFERWLAETLRLDPQAPILDYFRAALAEAPEEATLVLIFDSINEFETVHKGSRYSRRRFLEQCIDLAERADNVPELRGRFKVLVTLRWTAFTLAEFPPDLFEEVYADRAHLFFRPSASRHLYSEIPPIDDPELLFNRIRDAGVGGSPRFSWEEIPEELRGGLRKPLLLKLFMSVHDGCTRDQIRDRSVRSFQNRLASHLFQKGKEDDEEERERKRRRTELVLDILQEMKRQASQFLLLDETGDGESAELERVGSYLEHRGRLDEVGRPRFNAYDDLLTHQVLRQDMVRSSKDADKPSVPVRRISFVHELIARQLLVNIRTLKSEISRRQARALYIFVGIGILLTTAVSIAAGIMRGDWAFLGFALSLVIVLPSTVFLLDSLSRVAEKLRDRIDERLFGVPDILEVLDKFSVTTEWKKVSGSRSFKATIGYLGLLFSLSIIYLGMATDHRLLEDQFARVAAFLAASMLLFGAAPFLFSYSLRNSLIVGGGKLLRSTAIGRWFFQSLLEGVSAVLTLILVLTWLNLGFLATDEIFRRLSDGRLESAGFVARLPILGLPDIFYWPWGVFLTLLWLPLIGLPLSWRLRRRFGSRPGGEAELRRFCDSFQRGVLWVTIIALPVLAVASLTLYKPYLSPTDFGPTQLVLVKETEAFEVKSMEAVGLRLSPESLTGGAEAAAGIDHLEPVKGFAGSLTTLEIGETGISDLRPLLECRELKGVAIRNCPNIVDWSPLGSIPSLEQVELSGENVGDGILADLHPAQTLRLVSLKNTAVVNLEPLSRFGSLEFLVLESDREPSGILWPEELPFLKVLSLTGPAFGDLPTRMEAPHLKQVILLDTATAELSPLLRFPELTQVWIKGGEEPDRGMVAELSARGIDVYWNGEELGTGED